MRKFSLPNGLRVLLDPLPGMPVMGIGVHYHAGFRADPDGRSGLAHLVEHLMFQGGAGLPHAGYFTRVAEVGGSATASTYQDFTQYCQVVPPDGADRVLALEAERMGGLDITETAFRTQLDVVRDEIRMKTSRPYGGFPWTVLPRLLFRTFPNAHNGYGTPEDLDRITIDECARFHETSYVPANALLTVAGGFEPDRIIELVERHFGALPARAVPAPASLAEPHRTGETRGEHRDPNAPLPAVAVGYRLPDPRAAMQDYLAHMVLSGLLASGATPWLRQPPGHEFAPKVSTSCGFFGPLLAREPDTGLVVVTHPGGLRADDILADLDAALRLLSDTGPDAADVERVAARLAMSHHRSCDALATRTARAGSYELLHGTGELVDDLPRLLHSVTPTGVSHAAKSVLSDARAVVTLTPGENDDVS